MGVVDADGDIVEPTAFDVSIAENLPIPVLSGHDKDLECSVHGTALVEKEVPVFYGMPTADSDIFEIGSKFPHHGLWSIGACEVSDDSPETEIALVCADCHDAAKKM